MLWLANTGDDSIRNKGEEYSSENVFSHCQDPHRWCLRGPQNTPQAIDQGAYPH